MHQFYSGSRLVSFHSLTLDVRMNFVQEYASIYYTLILKGLNNLSRLLSQRDV